MATQFQVGDRVRVLDKKDVEGVVLGVYGDGRGRRVVSVRLDGNGVGCFIASWPEDLVLVQGERRIALGAVIEDMNDLRPGEWAVDRDGDHIERGERGFRVHYRDDLSAGRSGGFPIDPIALSWPEKYGPVRRCLKPRVLEDGSIWDGFIRPVTEPPTPPRDEPRMAQCSANWFSFAFNGLEYIVHRYSGSVRLNAKHLFAIPAVGTNEEMMAAAVLELKRRGGEGEAAGEAGEEIGRSILQGALAKAPIDTKSCTTIHGGAIRSVDQTTSCAPPEEPEPISDESEKVCFGTKETAADLRGADLQRLSDPPTPEPEVWFPSKAMLERADEERKRIGRQSPTRARR